MADKKEPKFKKVNKAYTYALRNSCRLNSINEKLIAQSDWYSYLYAKDILKGRFELGEKTIATSGYYSYCYALVVLNRRFELGEKAIAEIDFLELCSIEVLELILDNNEYEEYAKDIGVSGKINKIKNKDDIIIVLFKKRFLE